MSKERRIFSPEAARPWVPAKEWVTLVDGSEVCVWELSIPEQFQVAEAAQRHPQDPRPGSNEREAAVWLLAYACRAGEAPGSPRIWDDMHVHWIASERMNPEDFGRLLVAARGLVSNSEEAEKRARDFTPAPPAAGTPISSTGASSDSTGSRGNSRPVGSRTSAAT
jgi:hypothetical protein